MNVKFAVPELGGVLKKLATVVASRNTMPILENILIAADEDGCVTLEANNLEIGMRYEITAGVIDPGEITLPGRKLSSIVNALPCDTVQFATEGERAVIKAGSSVFRLTGLSTADFPDIPTQSEDMLQLPGEILASMFRLTVFAVSHEETRYFLQGVYLTSDGGGISAVATDGKRLSIAEAEHNQEAQPFGVIVPTGAVVAYLKTFGEPEVVDIGVQQTLVTFSADGVLISTRLIEGEYPDYNAVLAPAMENPISMVVDRENLLEALSRVMITASLKTPQIALNVGDCTRLSATDGENSAVEEIEAEVDGSVEIALNGRFLRDPLDVMDDERVILKFRDSLSPVLIHGQENQECRHIIMPMRLQK